MRALAEFVMKDRRRAIIAVLLLGLLPMVNLLSPVVVGLTLLRKGVNEALAVLVWALLPMGAYAYIGDAIPLILLLSVTGLAAVLRQTQSWELTLSGAMLVGLSVEAYLLLRPELLDLLFQQLDAYMVANRIEGLPIDELRASLTSLLAVTYGALAALQLMLARWMQAALYNPGGFRQEFHSLRIGNKVALLLVAITLGASAGVLPASWVVYSTLPLLFAGIALVHGVVALRQMPGAALTVFYAVMLLPIAMQGVVLLALIDSWYDFRARLQRSGS
ncbi:MAG: hypothetical protein P1V29_08700 [Gammaproteobacteria bacterium]|jgi:hypothetical protein|nr:hypothetical protein [Gammaproteobacteria bacterium]